MDARLRQLGSRRVLTESVTAAFIVGEPNPLAHEPVVQDPVLLLDVRDHVLLMPVHPAREGHENELPCLKSVHERDWTRPRTLRLAAR